MKSATVYRFSALPWEYSGKGAWIFVSLPPKMSAAIRKKYSGVEEGWGRLKTIAKTGNTEWATAIWFDSKQKTYLLPLKAAIRKKENISFSTRVTISLSF